MNITFWALSGLINCITSAALGLLVYYKNRKNPIHITYGLFCLGIAIWSCFYFYWQMSTETKSALFWCRALMAGAIFIAPFYLHYICALLNIQSQKRKILIFSYIFSFISFLLNFTPFFVKSVSQKMWFKYWPDPGIVFSPFLAIWGWIVLYGFYLLARSLKKSSGQKRNKLRYILVASAIAWSGGSTNFPLWFNILIPPIGNIFISIYVVIVAYAIIKYRLMDIKVAFTRAGIFLVVYTLVLGIPFIVLKRTGSGLIATSLAVIFATMGPLIYRFLQMKAESVILAKQHRYQKILLQTAVGMVTEHDLKKLSKLIVYILKKAIQINFSAIFIRDKENNLYRLESIHGESDIGEYVNSFSAQDPFIVYLKDNHEYFFFEEAPKQIKGSSNILFKSKVVIPALIGDELLGFVFLGEKINGQPYTDEDINVFKILSHQIALAIENCIFFEESKDSQQRMFAAEKLASIGGMADGVAHQIKNRLNLFSLAGGELKFEIKNFMSKHTALINSSPELVKTFKYLNELGASILDNVKRTDGIVRGILDFAKVEKKENFFAVFPFKETVKLSSHLVILKHEAASLPLTIKIDGEDAIYGVKSQLTEVIYNLLDNAYEAIKERKMKNNTKELKPFIPMIELSLTHTQNNQIIKISDNGIGIKEEDKPKIFAPFFTTKTSYKSGSGIGAYVVKRIIEENHRGKIWFTSNYTEGTSFIIELPKKPKVE